MKFAFYSTSNHADPYEKSLQVMILLFSNSMQLSFKIVINITFYKVFLQSL